jgi:hypothetical protein
MNLILEAIKAIKFDTKYPKESKFLESIQALYQIDATKYPECSTTYFGIAKLG